MASIACRRATRYVMAVVVALGLAGVSASAAFAAPGDLAFGTVTVDAANDGTAETSRAGERDRPLAGAKVRIYGSADPAAPLASTTTAADGSWNFVPADVGADPGPFRVVIDTEDVAGDLYLAGHAAPFTAVAGQPQQQQATGITLAGAPAELDALVYPTWWFSLIQPSAADGLGGKAVYTGSSPFDANNDPGNDSGAGNDVVRSGDVVAFNWSANAAANVPLANTFAGATFEQTITLGPGAIANFTQIPGVCEDGSGEVRAFVGTADTTGTVIQPGVDPPAGTTSLRIRCGLGPMGISPSTVLLATGIQASAKSRNGSTMTSVARVYATSGDVATARPSTEVASPPITISSAPRYDVEKLPGNGQYAGTMNIGGVTTPGYHFYYTVQISTDRRVGVEAFTEDVNLEESFWGLNNADVPQPDLRWYIDLCDPSPSTSGGQNVVTTVYGRIGIQTGSTATNSVRNSGTCTIGRTNAADATSNYTLTLKNIDTSGLTYPAQSMNGSALGVDRYYVASYRVRVFVPMSEIDRMVAPPDDGAGSIKIYNRVGNFDPTSVSGTSNFGTGYEPGYCPPGPNTDMATNCAAMPGGTRSNNVVGPHTIQITPGSWSKYLLDNRRAWANDSGVLPESMASHDGAGSVQPGQVFTSRQNITNSGAGIANAQMCDVFDNSMMKLVELNKDAVVAGAGYDAGLYSVVLRIPGSGTSVTEAQQRAYQSNWKILYGHVDLSADNPNTGVFDVANNRWEGDWTAQRSSVSTACANTDAGAWHADPNDVPGGIDNVNVVWAEAVGGHQIAPGEAAYWYVALEQRDTYHQGPHEGEAIPAGTVAANFGSVRSSTISTTGWRTGDYIPGAGNTGGTHRTGESTVGSGDRWTVVRARMALQKRTIPGTVNGEPARGVADFGSVGTAQAGKPVIWEIVSSMTTNTTPAAPVNNVVITDTLPKYVTYDEVATAALPGGTPATSYSVDAATGVTTLTWNLGTVTPGTAIAARRIATVTDPLTPPNTSVVNRARITADGIPGVAAHEDDHVVRLDQGGALQLRKSVDQTLDLQDQDQQYTLQVKNFSSSLVITKPTVIEVLSYGNDGTNAASVNRSPQSAFAGTNRLSAAPVARQDDGSTVFGGTFYYTTVAPDLVPQDLAQDTDPSIWSTTFTTDATAFKFVGSDDLQRIADASGSGLRITYRTDQADNRPGDLYANRFTAFSDTLKDGAAWQVLTSNQTTVRVVGFSLGDFVFVDVDDDGRYTPGTDRPAPEGVTVQVYREGQTAPIATTTTNDAGRWVVNNLATGRYSAAIPASEFATDGLLARHEVAVGGVADPDTDQNEPVDHNAMAADGGVRTGLVSLTATVAGSTITGDEPLGDNVAGLLLAPLTTDDFSNLTLDMAVRPAPGYTFTKTSNPASGTTVNPGGQITYTLTGSNTGATVLGPVTIDDDLTDVLSRSTLVGPPTATVDGVAAAAPAVTGSALRWSGTLPAGQAVVVTYTVRVDPDATGTLRNAATSSATPPAGPPITPPKRETEHPIPAPVPVPAPGPSGQPGVSIVKSTGTTGYGAAGDRITYRFVVTNTGSLPLTGVAVTDPVVTDVSCAFTTLAPGEVQACTGTRTVTAGDITLGRVVNTARVDATSPAGPVGASSNTVTVPYNRALRPRLAISKAGPARIVAGNVGVWRITVRNVGRRTATNVVITDPLPRGLVVSRIGNRGRISAGAIRWNVGSLRPGKRVTVTVRLRVPRTFGGIIVNRASARAGNVTGTVTATRRTTVMVAENAVRVPVTG